MAGGMRIPMLLEISHLSRSGDLRLGEFVRGSEADIAGLEQTIITDAVALSVKLGLEIPRDAPSVDLMKTMNTAETMGALNWVLAVKENGVWDYKRIILNLHTLLSGITALRPLALVGLLILHYDLLASTNGTRGLRTQRNLCSLRAVLSICPAKPRSMGIILWINTGSRRVMRHISLLKSISRRLIKRFNGRESNK